MLPQPFKIYFNKSKVLFNFKNVLDSIEDAYYKIS